MGQRSRKKGQRERAAADKASFSEAYRARSEAKNAEIRAGLEPLAPGERPWPIIAGVIFTAIAGGVQVVLYAIGTKVNGKPVPPSSLVLFVVMLACAIGMWRLWYQAVLAFMVLLAIIIVLFALLLVEASNVLGLVVGLAVVLGGGYLFWKLVRVLSRLQMPARPGR